MLESASKCKRCLADVAQLWTFCPTCGATIEKPAGPSEPRSDEPDELSIAALRLISDKRLSEAESLLRDGLRDSTAPEGRLLYARLIMDRSEFPAARVQLDEALRLSPRSYVVRIRRCEFFARVGLYLDALKEVEAARFLAPDVASLLHAQDLERRLSDMARGSFVRSTALPAAPTWIRSLRRRFKKSSTPVVS